MQIALLWIFSCDCGECRPLLGWIFDARSIEPQVCKLKRLKF